MKYGITKAKTTLLPKDLIRVPHKGGDLIGATFGPATYNRNTVAMSGEYFHSDEFPRVSFREGTTEESISVVAYQFGQIAKLQIFDTNWLQAGRIVKTSGGVFTNTSETDEVTLKTLLNKAEKVNGIYFIDDQMAFAPYESFKTGIQEGEEFAEGGLARALEHTDKQVAKNLKEIASFYEKGVNVWGFDKVGKPVSTVSALGSDRYLNYWLCVDGGNRGGSRSGCAFGVLRTGKASRDEK
ncbi:MAG: hypothetical protein ABIJ20_03445 [Nanoarchaeota archaeon]|nr:hypothetical protein [Nanoarchaeota archaeon]MBU1445436.1 hypothetical protein [Nanoarchaeota archaeon]MBU2406964.1 hypothetical protein [Nanoarchaeota archaeon]MBU2420244.1 hypothetical protein [Nanoarchaeota archaeon]MBU2474993.1 hypothetical protein [Nanoarchaeota archaeon]